MQVFKNGDSCYGIKIATDIKSHIKSTNLFHNWLSVCLWNPYHVNCSSSHVACVL